PSSRYFSMCRRRTFPTRRASDLMWKPSEIAICVRAASRSVTSARVVVDADRDEPRAGECRVRPPTPFVVVRFELAVRYVDEAAEDRKSTRLNSSHVSSSYAVFCL